MPRHTRANRHRKSKLKGKTRRGGGLIGKGGYGCVYRPALRCPGNAAINRSQQISKLVRRQNIPGEINGVDLLKSIDPTQDYLIYPLDDICPFSIDAQPNKAEVQETFLLPTNNVKVIPPEIKLKKCLFPDIEKDAFLIFNKDGGTQSNQVQFNQNQYFYFFQAFQNIFDAVHLLHKNNIVHNDIKPQNMVIKLNDAGDNFEFRLIDFGFMQTAGNIGQKYDTRKELNTHYYEPYVPWPFYATLYAYNIDLLNNSINPQNTPFAAYIIQQFKINHLFIWLQNWEEMIQRHIGSVPEKVYYRDPTHHMTTMGDPESMIHTLRAIISNKKYYFNYTKNMDIYSVGICLSKLFSRMFNTISVFSPTGDHMIKIYIPHHKKYIAHNEYDWKNAELEAWVNEFVETLALPFYDFIASMCEQNNYGARSILEFKDIYDSHFLPSLQALIFDSVTRTIKKGFTKYLYYVKPDGFYMTNPADYIYTPIPPTPTPTPVPALPVVPSVVRTQYATPPAMRRSMNLGVNIPFEPPPPPKRRVQVTGRGVSSSSTNNANSTSAIVGHQAKRVARTAPVLASPADSTNVFHGLSPIASVPEENNNRNQGFFPSNL